MKNLTSEQNSLISPESILNYELSNLYRQAKPRQHSRKLSDPINSQIYVHNFNYPCTLPSLDTTKPEKRSMSIFQRKAKRSDKDNYTDMKSKRFETLPLDIECRSKFPSEEKRRTFTSREESSLKKKFIEIDMLTLHTSYAKSDIKKTKNKFQAKEEIKELTPIPPKPAVAAFIQNYKMVNEHIDLDDLVRSALFGVEYKEKEFLYFGEIKKGEFDGKGVMVNRNWVFEGLWMHSKRYQGVEITPKGIYKGRFVHDERSKVGEFFWHNGEYYSGEWQKNKKHGTGVWKSKNGDVYMGQWVKGKVQGYGSHLTKNGQKYEGYFLNFLKHGLGKQHFPNGDFFEGTFKQGRPHGIGTYKWKNGFIYQGQFKQGFREGKGIIKKGGIEYQGSFQKQRAHGDGKITVYNGNNFDGKFVRGKKEGKGISKQSKRIYIGTWQDNKFIQRVL